MALEPEQYFRLARELYERITIPPKLAASKGSLNVSPDEIEGDFLSANPWLKPEMITVSCRRRALLDVRICFGKDLAPRACASNEERRDCRLRNVTVPPVTPR